MQRWMLFGLAGAMAFSAWACGDSEDDTGAGGGGGTTTSSSSGATGVTTGTMATSTSTTTGGGGSTPCSEACDKLEDVCMYGSGYCALNGNLGFADLNTCGGVNAECTAQCVLDDACMDVGLLFDVLTTEQGVLDCVAACYPTCFACVLNNCDSPRHAASQDDSENGRAYLECLAGCQDNDTTCAAGCATNNPGGTTTNVDTCAQTNCDAQCFGGT